MNLAPIRKAVVAGIGAGVSSTVMGLAAALEGGLTYEEVSAVVIASVGVGLGVGRLTWNARNEPVPPVVPDA